MRIKLTMSAAASLLAVSALAIQSLSPATAEEGDPQATASETPAAPEAAETTAEPEEVPGPPAGDTEGLIDVSNGEKTTPIDLPGIESANLITVLRWDFGMTGYTSTGDLYGGSAVGVFIDADIAGLLSVKSRKLALSNVDKDGGYESHEVAGLDLGGFFFGASLEVAGIESDTSSKQLNQFNPPPSAEAHVRIARLENGSTFLVEGLDVTAFAGQTSEDRTSRAMAKMHVTRLKSGSKDYSDYDVPPNTTYTISGLGKVVLNEQKITELPGDRYAAKVNAVRITLSTASLGLPVGTNIYIGSAEAIYYQ